MEEKVEFSCPPPPYMMTGKFPGIPAPDYNKYFLGNTTSLRYVCTSGSDRERAGLVSDSHVDYHHDIVLSRKEGGFTVNGGPFRRFDDPSNRDFLEAIHYAEFPKELDPNLDATKVHSITVRRKQKQKHKDRYKNLPHEEDLPPEDQIFEAGTPKEILDAAVAKTPNSILIPLSSNSAGTRYMLFTFPPERSGRSIQI